jgi:hypothetical protein
MSEIEQPTEELLAEVIELSEHRAQRYLTQERRNQLTQRINHIMFEINVRRGGDPDDAA